MVTDNGKSLRIDRTAKSTSNSDPAFVSKPEGSPVYYGFELIDETKTDGWIYGAITVFIEPGGCESGDGFVQAPDGSRAGLVWEVGEFNTEVICEPTIDRWGVYSIAFPKTIMNIDDLVFCFRSILPELKDIYSKIQ